MNGFSEMCNYIVSLEHIIWSRVWIVLNPKRVIRHLFCKQPATIARCCGADNLLMLGCMLALLSNDAALEVLVGLQNMHW